MKQLHFDDKMSVRSTSFWPLPGGYKHYLETLLKLLSKIAENPSFKGLTEWASKTLQKSSGWIDGSIRSVIVNSGLASLEGDSIQLTDKGLEFLKTKNPEVVLSAFLDRIWGIREIIIWLKQEGPLSRRQIYRKCVDFGVEWKHDYQVGYRLMWLQALGCVKKKQRKYLLTSTGLEMAENLRSGLPPEPLKEKSITVTVKTPKPTPVTPSEEALSHLKLQNMLAELGRLEGYRAEREFAVNSERLDVVWFRRVRERPDLAFEIQIRGDLYSALVKLKEAWDRWGCVSVLVTTKEYLEAAKRWLERVLCHF